jgi:hypothetical protein
MDISPFTLDDKEEESKKEREKERRENEKKIRWTMIGVLCHTFIPFFFLLLDVITQWAVTTTNEYYYLSCIIFDT